MKGISSMLSGEKHYLPEAVTKAFNHWPKISSSLHDLLRRAPAEAIADDASILAGMALQAIEEYNYPADLKRQINDEAQAVLARNAEANRERIETVLAEPVRLLKAIDEFIARAQRSGNTLPRPEAEAQVRKFLEWCRQLDRELSDTPARLKGVVANDR